MGVDALAAGPHLNPRFSSLAAGRRLDEAMDTTAILQLFFSGITNGAIYALVALGFVVIFSVTGVINFAQGEFVMLGALLMYTYTKTLGLPMWAGALASTASVSLVAAVLHQLALRPARRPTPVTWLIITIGAAITLRGLALIVWGTDPYALPAFTRGRPLMIAGAAIRLQGLWVMGTMLVVVGLLYLFFEYTLPGKAVRACAINKVAARLMGIDVQRMALLAFVIAGALGAIGGIVVTPMSSATYDMGLSMGLKGFAAAVMGGLVSAPIAVVGGLLLGVLEALGVAVLPSGFREAIAFAVLLVILLVRPLGMLQKTTERV